MPSKGTPSFVSRSVTTDIATTPFDTRRSELSPSPRGVDRLSGDGRGGTRESRVSSRSRLATPSRGAHLVCSLGVASARVESKGGRHAEGLGPIQVGRQLPA